MPIFIALDGIKCDIWQRNVIIFGNQSFSSATQKMDSQIFPSSGIWTKVRLYKCQMPKLLIHFQFASLSMEMDHFRMPLTNEIVNALFEPYLDQFWCHNCKSNFNFHRLRFQKMWFRTNKCHRPRESTIFHVPLANGVASALFESSLDQNAFVCPYIIKIAHGMWIPISYDGIQSDIGPRDFIDFKNKRFARCHLQMES